MSNSTDLTGYDLVIAVTEDAINSTLQNAKIWQGEINVQTNPSVDQAASPGIFGATLSSPTVSLVLPSGAKNTNQVNLTLAFSAGTLQLIDINTGSIVQPPTDITGWQLNVNVDLALADVDSDEFANLPQDVQAKLESPLLSVGKLFLNMTSIDWTNVAISSANGPVTDSITVSTLETALQTYFQSLDSALSSLVMNYLMKATSNGGEQNLIPAFIPTSYDYSVTPYSPAGQYNSLSTINYLMMTEGRAAPTDATAGIFSSNWIAGPNTDGSQGVLTMANSLFMSGYVEALLLPAIATAVGYPGATFTQSGNTWTLQKSNDLYTDQNDGKGELVQQSKEHLGFHAQSSYLTVNKSFTCTVTFDGQTTPQFTVHLSYDATATWDIVTLDMSGPVAQDYSLTSSFTITLLAGANGTMVAQVSDLSPADPQPTAGDPYAPPGSDWHQKLGSDVAQLAGSVEGSTGDQLMSNMSGQFSKVSLGDLDAVASNLQKSMDAVSKSVVFPGGSAFAFADIGFTDDSEENLQARLTIKN